MNCRMAWDKRFLSDVLPKTFLSRDWVRHREKVLLERERSLFPTTVELINFEKELRRLYEERREKINAIWREYENLEDPIRRRIRELRGGGGDTTPSQTRGERRFTRPCPLEECRGYLSNTNGECGVCSSVICLECNILKTDEPHTCSEDDLAVWKEISSNTKPCPNCGVRIFKISGCAQMWCVSCFTAFSWVTGEIETGTIHNPHYYQYLFRNPGQQQGGGHHNHLDGGPCAEGIPRQIELRVFEKHPSYIKWLGFYRLLVHINRVEIQNITYNDTNRQANNLETRIEYLTNEITEEQFKTRLQRREKRRCLEADIRRVLEMLYAVGCDILRNMIAGTSVEDSLTAQNNLMQYANEAFNQIGIDYQCKVPHIHIESLDFLRYTQAIPENKLRIQDEVEDETTQQES